MLAAALIALRTTNTRGEPAEVDGQRPEPRVWEGGLPPEPSSA